MAQKTMILPELHYQSVYDPVTPPLVRALSAPNVPTSNSLSSPHHDGSGVDDDEETSAAPITLLKQKAVQNLGQAISEPITATTLNKLASAITESFHTDYYQKEVAKLEKMINRLHKFEIATGLVGDIARTVELIAPAGAVLGMISKFFGYVKSVKTIMLEALGLVRSSVETTISIQDCLVTIEFKVPLAMIRCIINFYEILEECTTTMSGIVERTSLFKETLHRNKYRDMVKYMQAKLGDTKSDFIQCGILINCSYSYKQSSIFSDNTSDVNEESDDFILTSALMNALQLNNDNLSDYLGLNQLTIQEMISLRAILQARRTPAQASSSTTRLASPADQRSTASPRAESTQQSATHQIFMVLGIKYDKADSPGLNGNVTEDDVEENSRPPGGHAKYAEGPANHGYKIPLDSAGNLVIEILSQRISTESETASGGGIDEIGLIKERLLGSHAEKGSTSTVWKGSYLGTAVRIKRLDWLDHVPGTTTETLSSSRQVYLKQIQLLKTMTISPFIMCFVGAIDPTEYSSQWSIVSEYMPHGDVLAYLDSEAGRQADRVALAYQVAQGLEHLHNQQIIHANLTPSNVLIGHGGQAVLADFGYISELESFAPDRLTTRKKAPFIAPEVAAGGSSTELSDVFSFGKTAFQGWLPPSPMSGRNGVPTDIIDPGRLTTPSLYTSFSVDVSEKPHHRFAIKQVLDIMRKIGMTRMSDTKDFTPYSMKIRLKWWETSVTLNRAKTLPGISDAQRQALSGKIDSLGSKSNYLNSEPSYVSHGFFRRAPEVLMRSLPAFRANCYTSYSLVDDTVKLYTLLQYVGNQMSSDPPADWLLAYEAASRRLVDNVEILRTVSACDTYIQLIFWEILHEVMWASRILTCQRLVALRNCADGSSGSSDDQSRHFWDSLCTLKAERRLCDSILVKQLLRRGEDAGSCELLLAGRFPEDNLHLLGCVLRCEDFKSEDPKPTGFLGRLEDYPTWSSPILTILGDLDARALNDEELVLSKLPVMEKEESLLPKQEREILALVRGEDFMAYHEKLQDAWDVCSAHITEYESGFGGSQFPSLDEESLLSTIKFTRDDQEITESKIDIPGKGPAKIRIDRDYVLGTGHNQSLTLRNIPADKLSLTGKLGEAVDTNRKEGPTESLWSRVGEDLEGSDSAMEIIDYFDDDGIPEPLP